MDVMKTAPTRVTNIAHFSISKFFCLTGCHWYLQKDYRFKIQYRLYECTI